MLLSGKIAVQVRRTPKTHTAGVSSSRATSWAALIGALGIGFAHIERACGELRRDCTKCMCKDQTMYNRHQQRAVTSACNASRRIKHGHRTTPRGMTDTPRWGRGATPPRTRLCACPTVATGRRTSSRKRRNTWNAPRELRPPAPPGLLLALLLQVKGTRGVAAIRETSVSPRGMKSGTRQRAPLRADPPLPPMAGGKRS